MGLTHTQSFSYHIHGDGFLGRFHPRYSLEFKVVSVCSLNVTGTCPLCTSNSSPKLNYSLRLDFCVVLNVDIKRHGAYVLSLQPKCLILNVLDWSREMAKELRLFVLQT